MSETDEILGSQRLSMITSKHFSTFWKFPKKIKIKKKLKKNISEMVRDRA